jgi:hypothetical protein
MTTHAGELVFLHQTLLEYLAARHACRSPAHRARTLEKVFTHVRWHWPWSADILRSPKRLTPQRVLIPPHRDDSSYIGFLIDVAQEQDPDATGPYLQRLAADGNIEGCRFLAEQAQLGTTIPAPAARAAAESCALLASRPTLRSYWRLEAAQLAADIDVDCAAPVFSALAADPTMYANARVHAARCVAQFDKEHATSLLVSLASNRGLNRQSRVNAARRLADLDPARATAVCTALVEDATIPPYLRIEIVDLLIRLGDPPPEELYEELFQDPDFETWDRRHLTRLLEQMNEPLLDND